MDTIPMQDLGNAVEVERRCSAAGDPACVTKNGRGRLVVMGMDYYEKTMGETYEAHHRAARPLCQAQPRPRAARHLARNRLQRAHPTLAPPRVGQCDTFAAAAPFHHLRCTRAVAKQGKT